MEDPIANSSVLVLPKQTAPAFHKRSVVVASNFGTKFDKIRDAAVVRMSFVQNISLMATGTPSSLPTKPLALRSSDASAIFKAFL